ncbi:hypothetical protein [Nocardia stercoris]|uniref:Ig-like domain repeat protein n=1 Tax=Nocardia stercoris TaxID=2483361 RepID=A0A3M2KYZ6_9NOCA|nr:hypothetical protein [Nocardia stercoris]RMI29856.1 hypothetical protein EBN03_23965 [Nocardia stercoris]
MNNQHAATRLLGRSGATSAVAILAGLAMSGAPAGASPLDPTLTVEGTPEVGCPLLITGHVPTGPSDMLIVFDNGTETIGTATPPIARLVGSPNFEWTPTEPGTHVLTSVINGYLFSAAEIPAPVTLEIAPAGTEPCAAVHPGLSLS